MTVPRNSQYTNVVLVDPTTGDFYAATGVAGGPAVTVADGADVNAGATDDAAAAAGDAAATLNALLKGLLVAIGDATDTSADNTVIGVLKLIAENTTPAP